MTSDTRRWRVEEEPGQDRLDAYLAARVTELSRSGAARLLEQGHVLVDGAPGRKSDTPRPGSELLLHLPAPEPSHIAPEDLPLTILYEDEDLAVIEKAAGMVVHPAPGHRSGTLVNALLFHMKDLSGIGGVLRPGIVHRLDRDTSGLMLVAKTDDAHRALSDALKRREVRRRYLAAAWGHVDREEWDVDAPIGRARTDRKRMAVMEGGRRARTRFTLLERWRAADLLRAELDTGRTHQIRVHLRYVGHPVVGDRVYGDGWERGFGGADRGWAQELAKRTRRQFLHAAELEFAHPRGGRHLSFSSALPKDLDAVAEWARES
ncbi:MAG: RluA family pseudouridine synthase [Gemmatimonadota bacterium]